MHILLLAAVVSFVLALYDGAEGKRPDSSSRSTTAPRGGGRIQWLDWSPPPSLAPRRSLPCACRQPCLHRRLHCRRRQQQRRQPRPRRRGPRAARVLLLPLHPPPSLQVRHPRRCRNQVRHRGGEREARQQPHHRPADVHAQDAPGPSPRPSPARRRCLSSLLVPDPRQMYAHKTLRVLLHGRHPPAVAAFPPSLSPTHDNLHTRLTLSTTAADGSRNRAMEVILVGFTHTLQGASRSCSHGHPQQAHNLGMYSSVDYSKSDNNLSSNISALNSLME